MTSLLHYATCGQARGTALLLVHPMGTDGRFWEECVAVWQARFHCIVPDLANAGGSPRTEAPVTIPGHAAHLERLREQLGVAGVVPIGCALGGMVAACYAARYPGAARALVMANPGVRNPAAADDMLRERVRIARASGMAALTPAAAERAFHHQPRDARFSRHVERYEAQDAQVFARSVEGFIGADITDELPRIACPVLLVCGEHDLLMPADAAQRIEASVPQAEVLRMDGAAHFLPFQAPDRFAHAVIDFLDRRVPPPI